LHINGYTAYEPAENNCVSSGNRQVAWLPEIPLSLATGAVRLQNFPT